jgi:hypothetical protein
MSDVDKIVAAILAASCGKWNSDSDTGRKR